LIHIVLGIVLICFVFYDVYHGVVLPRQSSRTFRLAPLLIGRMVWLPYRNMALKIENEQTREDILGNFGALAFLILVVVWLGMLITGYASIFWGLREDLHPAIASFSEAYYFAGTAVLTIGFGDVVPTSGLTRATALLAGLSGLSMLGLCLSFVFNLQNFLYQREVPLSVLFSRLEGKFSGLNLLLQHAKCGTVDFVRSDIRDWEKWLGTVLESHRDFPILCYFRSTGHGESWITCLGSMLDMCNILLTCVEGYEIGECRFFHRLGASSVQLLGSYLNLPINVCEFMSPYEFDTGYQLLKDAGFQMKNKEEAWKAFGPSRCQYAPYISALCIYYAAKEPRWLCPGIGECQPVAEAVAESYHDTGAGVSAGTGS
jgi:Ion channel